MDQLKSLHKGDDIALPEEGVLRSKPVKQRQNIEIEKLGGV